jgi:mannose-6-phosphate isomerase
MLIRPVPRLVRPPWGGTRLSRRYSRGLFGEKLGESWEASSVDAPEFPLLIKLLDIEGVLSVQVHPDDAAAARLEGQSRGKAEGWVVLEAGTDAEVALGLLSEHSLEELQARALSGEVEKDLRWVSVKAGDVISVPPGTIHTMRGSLLLYEVQQDSDLTYRFYDWGRPRQLHLEKALEVADRSIGKLSPVQAAKGRILSTPQFVLDRVELEAEERWEKSCWEAWTVIEGEILIQGESVAAGETVLVEPGARRISGRGTALVAAPG